MLEGDEDKETGGTDKAPLVNYITGAGKSFADYFAEAKDRMDNVDRVMAQINASTQSLNKNLGGSEVYLAQIGKNISDAAIGILKVSDGITTVEQAQAKAAETIKLIQDKTYRGYIATGKELEGIIQAQEASGVEAANLIERFKSMGYSLQSIPKEMQKVIDTSKALGVNVDAVSESVTANLKQMNLFNFSNGVEGLTKMAAQAGMFGIKMESIFQLSEDLLSPESAVEKAASLQRLGVAAGDLLDPLKLMDLGQNNPEELQNQIAEMSKQFTYFNEEQQKFEILPGAKRQLREVAAALGIPNDQLAEMALKSSEFADKMSKIKFPDLGFELPEDQKTMIANMAEMKDGEYKIQVKETKLTETGERVATGVVREKSISELNPEDLASLQQQQKENNKSLEEIGREGLNYSARIATAAEGLLGQGRLIAGTTNVAQGGTEQINKILKDMDKLFEGVTDVEGGREAYDKMVTQTGDFMSSFFKSFEGGLSEKEKEEMKKKADEMDKMSKEILGKTTSFFTNTFNTLKDKPEDFIKSLQYATSSLNATGKVSQTKGLDEQAELNRSDRNIMENIRTVATAGDKKEKEDVKSSDDNSKVKTENPSQDGKIVSNTSTTTNNNTNNQNITNNNQQTIYQTMNSNLTEFSAILKNFDLSKMSVDITPLNSTMDKHLKISQDSYLELQKLNEGLKTNNESLITSLTKLEIQTETKKTPEQIQKDNLTIETKKDVETKKEEGAPIPPTENLNSPQLLITFLQEFNKNNQDLLLKFSQSMDVLNVGQSKQDNLPNDFTKNTEKETPNSKDVNDMNTVAVKLSDDGKKEEPIISKNESLGTPTDLNMQKPTITNNTTENLYNNYNNYNSPFMPPPQSNKEPITLNVNMNAKVEITGAPQGIDTETLKNSVVSTIEKMNLKDVMAEKVREGVLNPEIKNYRSTNGVVENSFGKG